MCRPASPLVVVITAFLGITLARAQGQATGLSLFKTGLLGMGTDFGLYDKGPMLDSPAVLKELKVTEAQRVRLDRAKPEADRISERIGRENRRLQAQFKRQANQKGLAEQEQAGWKLVLSLSREDEGPLLEVLDSHQRSRLEELQLQADGPWAFMRPEVQDRLKMSPEQVEGVKAKFEQGRQTITQAAVLPATATPVSRGLPPEKRAELLKSKVFAYQVEKVRKQVVVGGSATMGAIAEILTKEQRARFEQMLGLPFEFPKMSDRPARITRRSAADRSKGSSNR
jgi:hypothetical protein